MSLSAEEHKAKGNAAFAKNNITEAIYHYTEAIRLDGSNHVYYSNRSAAHLSEENAESALADAEVCVELSPSFAKGYSRKGAALHAAKRFDDSILVYEEALKNFPSDAGLAKGIELAQIEKGTSELKVKVNLNGLNKELLAHCDRENFGISNAYSPEFTFQMGALMLDPLANCTSRNVRNMYPWGIRTIICRNQLSSAEKKCTEDGCTETVSLVYDTNMNFLNAIEGVDEAHYWTDLSGFTSDSKPTANKAASLLVFWHPRHVKFEIQGDTKHQADDLCLQITTEAALQSLVVYMKTHHPNGITLSSKPTKEELLFMEAYCSRLHDIRASSASVFPPQMTDDECQSILSTLSKKTGVKEIRVHPLAALADQSSQYELLMSFGSLVMAKGDCSLCPTEDFVVAEAKQPNVHGCDLQLKYGKQYCTHMAKQMQFQVAQQFPGMGHMFVSTKKTSADGCKTSLL